MNPSLLPLFFVSAVAVGVEIALTRYFAVAKWSEYGYWVISIVMVGFALSGVLIALLRAPFERRGAAVLAWLPSLLLLTGAGGFWFATVNPFNPLQLQNDVTFWPQIGNIALYYAALLPFFFLAGLFVSLSFVCNQSRVSLVYGYDLTGAGAGAAAVLALMLLVHPFLLVPALLPGLALAAWFGPYRRRAGGAALLVLLLAEALLLGDGQAGFNDFKAIYAPLHVPNAAVVAEIRSPRGLFQLLDDFTERVDTDISNDAAELGIGGPPSGYGLYRDGNRIATLPKPPGSSANYAKATLDGVAYALLTSPRVLLVGASGGFRVRLALGLGARQVDALEPDPVQRAAILSGLGPAPAWGADPRARILADGPLARAAAAANGRVQRYDLIDLSADFLDGGEANVPAFSAEAIALDLAALSPGGILSIPVSIRDFPTYALRMLASVRAGLARAGITDPGAHVMVARSAWNVRILVGADRFDAARIAAAKQFCAARSFDLSYYPGIDVPAARAGIYNDLPAVSFAAGEVSNAAGPTDAIADEAAAVLAGTPTPSDADFNLAPITLDRPFYYAILRLDRIGTIMKRLELLPQAEVGQLVNLAVLGQALVIALLVLAVPAVAGGRVRGPRGGMARAILYFSSLGLGFLCIEIWLIEKASLLLNDRTMAFALVLTGMLIFSGIGALLAGRIPVPLAFALILAWCLAMLLLERFELAALGLPLPARLGLLALIILPVSVALGVPFPAGLARAAHLGGGFLPWAWAVNGAMSVVATPLANLIALTDGFGAVIICALMLYGLAALAHPPRGDPALG